MQQIVSAVESGQKRQSNLYRDPDAHRQDARLRKRILAIQRLAHRVLGMRRKGLGLGLIGGTVTGAVMLFSAPAGAQTFNGTDTLDATTAHAVSGGTQTFNHNSALNALVTNAVSGGTQGFYHTSVLNATAANAVSGGTQTFYQSSVLNASFANAVSGGGLPSINRLS